MSAAIEELGLTRDKYEEMYNQYGGFNTNFNKNAPSRNEGETVYAFLKRGAESLVKENADIVNGIAEEG